MDSETVHRLIHCNFQHLHLLHPAPFAFTEGMFKVPNKKGFENAMHYLLKTVDPVKCAKMIPWPLIDKKGESQFRTSVKMFLMEINHDYPEANLPKIVPSFLMNPGGDKFAYFMWKLTKFVLMWSLCRTYGTSDILLPPRTFVNDPMASAKLSVVHALAESVTQKAISNQMKLDSLLSKECERQYRTQLNDLVEAITKHEKLLKELIKDSFVSAELKEKLCSSFDNSDVIAEWVGVVEAEGRVLEAIVHVLNKTSNSVTNLLETIKQVEDNDASQICLDPSSLNICPAGISTVADDFKEIMKNARSGKLSLSEFIESLTRLQASLIQHIVNNDLQDMSTILPDLCSLGSEFKELAVMLRNIETKLQQKLNSVQNSCEVLHKEFKTMKFGPQDKTEVSSSIDSSVPDGAIGEDVCIRDQTPDWDVTGNIFSKLTKNKTVANIVIDPQLIQTPEFDRKVDSPLHLRDVHSTGKEYETPVCKHNYMFPATTSKKSLSSDVRSLTNSLVRKKKTAGKAAELQSVPRLWKKGHKTRAARAVSKELFEKCAEDTGEKVGQPEEFAALSPVGESSSVTNASEDHVNPSAVPEDDLTSSPSSLFCSSEPSATEEQTNKKENRRKSLTNLIERYRKIRQNMELK